MDIQDAYELVIADLRDNARTLAIAAERARLAHVGAKLGDGEDIEDTEYEYVMARSRAELADTLALDVANSAGLRGLRKRGDK